VSENELRYTSTLDADVFGMAMSDDGLRTYAGMSGTTCTIHTGWGCPTADVDLPTKEEVVHDHWEGMTLGSSVLGVHMLQNEARAEDQDILVEGVRAAKLTHEGVMWLSGDDAECELNYEDGSSVDVPGAACGPDAQTSVDRAGAALIIATSEGVLSLGRDGATKIAERSDLVAWDRTTKQVYYADVGDTDVSAMTRRGSKSWTETTGGAIQSLTDMGRRGELLLLVDDGSGFGLLERRDGETGKLLGRTQIPAADGTLHTSGNGLTIGVEREGQVVFYSLEVGDSDERPIDEDPPNCPDMDRVTMD